ncbi:hypothetical protein BAJUN_01490 [Bajunvirus bajun]|uniref:Uncharacterized protein n=1 Tax=Brevundimonas phage vB_BgoS-Bajun TaxID=2948594 RepID=A0A9E7SS00_9CAUD|nr:hypothetical protein BAJUN_01490 [Brevundimonas phage vB_BgoS-Bajun]
MAEPDPGLMASRHLGDGMSDAELVKQMMVPSDKQHADAIRDAVKVLNGRVVDAAKSGLDIEINQVEMRTVGGVPPCPVLNVTIARPL